MAAQPVTMTTMAAAAAAAVNDDGCMASDDDDGCMASDDDDGVSIWSKIVRYAFDDGSANPREDIAALKRYFDSCPIACQVLHEVYVW